MFFQFTHILHKYFAFLNLPSKYIVFDDVIRISGFIMIFVLTPFLLRILYGKVCFFNFSREEFNENPLAHDVSLKVTLVVVGPEHEVLRFKAATVFDHVLGGCTHHVGNVLVLGSLGVFDFVPVIVVELVLFELDVL